MFTTMAAASNTREDAVNEIGDLADSARPQLRADLVIIEADVQGNTHFRIKVPDSGDFFQIGETEYLILSLMNGRRTYLEISEIASTEHDLLIDAKVVERFVRALSNAGCLETGQPRNGSRRKRRSLSAVLKNILYINVHLFNPDPILTKYASRVRYFFTWQFLAFTSIALVSGVAILAINRDQLTMDVMSLGLVSGIVSLYLAAAFVTALHEFAHGFACKHFGGEVPSMGALLIMTVIPCFYTDVSDAWLFKNKRHRLWVTAAGVIFESLIWSIATVIWLITTNDSLIHQLALAVIISSGIGIIFTLNPLLKFDGYFLVSDALDIPNLRDKAMAYFSLWLGTLFGSGKARLPNVSKRNARVFIVYGFAALTITFVILGSVLTQLSIVAISNWGGIFILPVIYLGWVMLGSTLKGIWAGIKAEPNNPVDRGYEPSGSVMQVENAQLQETKAGAVSTLAARKQLPEYRDKIPDEKPPKSKTPLFILVLLLALLVMSEFISGTLEIDGSVAFRPDSQQSVEPRVPGFIAEVYVAEGSEVKAGDPLVRIDDENLRLSLNSIETEITDIENRLALLLKGPKQEEIDAKLATIDMIVSDTEYFKSVYEQLVLAPLVITRLQLLEAKFKWEQVEHRLVVAKRELDLLLSPPQPEELQAMRAQLDNLKTQREKYISDIDNALVRAPIDGVVVTKMPQNQVGRYVAAGTIIIDIEDNQSYTALVSIRERDASLIALGQRVELKIFGYPYRVFEGRVRHIASTLGTTEINGQIAPTITVEAEIDDPERLIKTGMGGNAKVFTSEYSYREILFRKFGSWFKFAYW